MINLKNILREILLSAHTRNIARALSLKISHAGSSFSLHAGETHKNPDICTSDQTIYDLASLTKIIGTALSFARLANLGFVNLDNHLFDLWPQVCIKNLLSHKSGLLSHKKFFQEIIISRNFSQNKDLILQEIKKYNPRPTKISIYSDLGYIILGWYLEKLTKKSLWEIFDTTWDYFDIKQNFLYFESEKNITPNLLVAPTGLCPIRKILIRAQVNDLNTYFMGGLAGHAGIFGDLDSVHNIGEFLLKSYLKPKNNSEQIVKYFIQNNLGFESAHQRESTYNLSPKAFGHLGYTGTSLFIDPGLSPHGTVCTLLTNRVHSSRLSAGIFWLRKKIHKALTRYFESTIFSRPE